MPFSTQMHVPPCVCICLLAGKGWLHEKLCTTRRVGLGGDKEKL